MKENEFWKLKLRCTRCDEWSNFPEWQLLNSPKLVCPNCNKTATHVAVDVVTKGRRLPKA